jgi:hypothetical protein
MPTRAAAQNGFARAAVGLSRSYDRADSLEFRPTATGGSVAGDTKLVDQAGEGGLSSAVGPRGRIPLRRRPSAMPPGLPTAVRSSRR